MRHIPKLLALVLVLGTLGCRPDYKRTADNMVEENYLKSEQRCTAIPFFEKGGRYFDDDDSTTVDREILLPLLKQLHDLARSQQWVVPHKDDAKRAFAILIELPRDKATLDKMAQTVEKADAQFSGLILQQWGHRWLSLDFVDEEQAEFFKRADPATEHQR